MIIVIIMTALLASPTPLADAAKRANIPFTVSSQGYQPLLSKRVPNRAERIILKACMALNVGGNAYDATTTIRAIDSGRFVEGNPALKWIGDEPKKIIPVKAAYIVGSTWAIVAVSDDHPRIAAASACISGGIALAAGLSNQHRLRR